MDLPRVQDAPDDTRDQGQIHRDDERIVPGSHFTGLLQGHLAILRQVLDDQYF